VLGKRPVHFQRYRTKKVEKPRLHVGLLLKEPQRLDSGKCPVEARVALFCGDAFVRCFVGLLMVNFLPVIFLGCGCSRSILMDAQER
jgi:hypothetical protein